MVNQYHEVAPSTIRWYSQTSTSRSRLHCPKPPIYMVSGRRSIPRVSGKTMRGRSVPCGAGMLEHQPTKTYTVLTHSTSKHDLARMVKDLNLMEFSYGIHMEWIYCFERDLSSTESLEVRWTFTSYLAQAQKRSCSNILKSLVNRRKCLSGHLASICVDGREISLP